MGAEYNDYQFPSGTKKEELFDLAQEVFDEARYDYGHAGYSGSFAECGESQFTHKVFDTTDEAYKWVFDTAEKWGPALIVTVQAPANKFSTYYMGAWCSS